MSRACCPERNTGLASPSQRMPSYLRSSGLTSGTPPDCAGGQRPRASSPDRKGWNPPHGHTGRRPATAGQRSGPGGPHGETPRHPNWRPEIRDRVVLVDAQGMAHCAALACVL
jgi:hypothetical protein